jgi:hypothetical protein
MVADIKKKEHMTLPMKATMHKRLDPISRRIASVKILKKDGFTVGKLSHKINEAALKRALVEFP